ncbi:hypothetical protein TNIN_73381 [Trichonephila inaurata madagascariensis]|uniref:Uncharacterized protein n=1 Tax=Trichonephila inaurata madagascariensis TaxID=2747483 RepID=A0A8X6WQL1_9ARAC|nr:hypothetical protein TNIN_73381 [Trichonephila inaurata madagascariensis]
MNTHTSWWIEAESIPLCSWTELSSGDREKKFIVFINKCKVNMIIIAEQKIQKIVQHPGYLDDDKEHKIKIAKYNKGVELFVDSKMKRVYVENEWAYSPKVDGMHSIDSSKEHRIDSFTIYQGCGAKIIINGSTVEFNLLQKCNSNPS